MTTAEKFKTGSPIDSLYNKLTLLESRYAGFLLQEEVEGDLYALKRSIEGYFQGEPEATDYLKEHGMQLLEDIKSKLEVAMIEQMRINEESPNAEHSTGRKAHQLSRAAALVTDAEEKLESGLGLEKQH